MKTFVIHLERATAREAQVQHILSHLPEAEVLPACDGPAMTQAERDAIYPGPAIHFPAYPFALSAGEIGCFLSHRATWDMIVAQDLPFALVCEDDIEIDPDVFAGAFSFAQAHMGQFGVIQFQVRDLKPDAQEVASDGAFRLMRPTIVPVRMSAQLITRQAAQAFLDASQTIDRPVDSFVQMRWQTGVEVACVVPSGVSDRTAETGGSTLQTKRGFWDELAVTLPRMRYKRAIKTLSQRN